MSKIKGLFAVIEDGANEAEVQNAIMLAQRLMAKYNIEKAELSNSTISVSDVISFEIAGPTTSIRWYKKTLASIIADNFKTKVYISRKNINGKEYRVITLMGLEGDCILTQEVYLSTMINMLRLGKNNVDKAYETTYKNHERSRKITNTLLDSYYFGFTKGLKEAFEEQAKSFEGSEYAIAIQTPTVVVEKWDEFSTSLRTVKGKVHSNIDKSLYEQGKKDGYSSQDTPQEAINN